MGTKARENDGSADKHLTRFGTSPKIACQFEKPLTFCGLDDPDLFEFFLVQMLFDAFLYQQAQVAGRAFQIEAKASETHVRHTLCCPKS